MVLKIGPIQLEMPVLLAPMSGVTDLPFRKIVKKYGAGLVISEMIASEAMIRKTRQSLKKSQLALEEFPMAVQLAGCDPKVMAQAARLNVDNGAQLIDINMGCPVKKVVKGHAGSALMRQEDLALRIIDATVRSVSTPVTLKMRMGWDHDSLNAPTLAKKAEALGIQMVTIHGRTRCQLYTGQADWPFIRKVKDEVTIPVIGNGDVRTVHHAQELLEVSGADGVMIGRGCYGRPWFIKQVAHFLKTNEILPDPSSDQKKAIIREHLDEMLSHYGKEMGLMMMRKHLGWYSKGIPEAGLFRSQINTTESVNEVENLIEFFF